MDAELAQHQVLPLKSNALGLTLANTHPAMREQGAWLQFENPREVLSVFSLDAFGAAWEKMQAAVAAGQWVAGWLAYEAAPFFDPAFVVCASSPDAPLACFAIFDAPRAMNDLPASEADFAFSEWRPALERDDYEAAVERARELIAAGDAYQVNYSFPLEAQFRGDVRALMAAMQRAQGKAQGALVETPARTIVSASPELFFHQDGDAVLARPMKGTAPRGRWLEEDRARAAALAASAKDRAENVMIADMLRNDLGRVARPGSVAANPLFAVERYETVWQMTSTVRAETDADPFATLAALFPCASITGAPKIRAMQIINALENRPRGVYTGAIGWIGPGRRAWFNVAIRTIEIEADGAARYGVGGGITWASRAGDEYRECLDKAAVLRERPDFELMESMRWDAPKNFRDAGANDADGPLSGFLIWPRHSERLKSSAEYFGFAFDMARVRAALLEWERGALDDPATASAPQRVRLMLAKNGDVRIENFAMPPAPRPDMDAPFESGETPLKLAWAPEPIDAGDILLYHKTTRRERYDRAQAACPDADAALLWNARGEVTEASFANLIVETEDGRRLTPARDCGLLGGTVRADLLARGLIEEAVLRREDVEAAKRLWIATGTRGVVPAEMMKA